MHPLFFVIDFSFSSLATLLLQGKTTLDMLFCACKVML
jgi:hypothetical protein